MGAVYLPIRGIIWGVLRRVLQFRFGLVKSGSFEGGGGWGEGEPSCTWGLRLYTIRNVYIKIGDVANAVCIRRTKR